MSRRSYPLWLLRDVLTFVSLLVASWRFIFTGLAVGADALVGKQITTERLQRLYQRCAQAESWLNYALLRQAWRACGYSASCAKWRDFVPPTTLQELCDRSIRFTRVLKHMEHVVVAYAGKLRIRYNLSRADIGDPNAARDPLRRATRATSPGFAERGKTPTPLASLSRLATGGGGMRVLHAHDGGGLSFRAHARGPPPHLKLFENPRHIPQTPRVRERTVMPRNPRAQPPGNSAPPSAQSLSTARYAAAPLHP